MAKRSNVYVIWNTPNRGVYSQRWEEIKSLVIGVPGVLYKGFKTMEEAQKAYEFGYLRFNGLAEPESETSNQNEAPTHFPDSGLSTQPEGEEGDSPF